VRVVERRRRQRRWSARAASTAVEETSTSGVDGGRGDRWSRERERQGLRDFWDEKRNDTGRSDIYRFENIRSSFKPEPMSIVLESGPKRFGFKTVVDEGSISNSSQLEPLLIS
jgi:hypothetical protein